MPNEVKAQNTIDLTSLKDLSDAVDNTDQYFWHTTTDTGAGAGSHITQVPQVDFLNDPTNGGGNTLIDSLGMKIRNGLNIVAKFLDSGITLGKDNNTQSYLFADYHSLQMIDRNRNVYVHISDLRDRNGYAEFVETFVATRGQTDFSVEFPVDSPTGYTPSVTVNSQSVSFSISSDDVTFIISPVSAGDDVEITYKTSNFRTKAFSIGLRDPNADIGAMSYAEGLYTVASGSNSHAEGNRSVASGFTSHAEGTNVIASGIDAHAEGVESTASGAYSHAEGIGTNAQGPASHAQNFYTVARYSDQTAIGSFNKNKSVDAFEIGNGGGEDDRSNAFEVDWYGTATAYPTEFSNGIGFNVKHGITDKDSGIETTRTDTNVVVMFGIGAGGINHGIYSRKLGKWLIRGDDTNVYINQDVNVSSQAANKVLASPNGSTGKPNFRELVAADIPNLNASKITAGTLGADRIPNLNASKITAGTLGAARLPDLVKIVSGTTSAFSLAGGAGFYKDVSISVPSGYTLVGCVGANSSHNQAVYIGSMYKSDTNKIRVSGRNSGTSAFSDMTVTVYGLCINSNVVG